MISIQRSALIQEMGFYLFQFSLDLADLYIA